jgi:hypothetical protein
MVSRLRLRGYALFGLAFLLGIVSGGAASYAYAEHVYSRLLSSDHGESRDERRLLAFARELSLSDVQREQVRRIFEQRRPERERRLAAMFESCGQPVIDDREQLNAELRKVLEPGQHAAFDAFIERHRRFGPVRH